MRGSLKSKLGGRNFFLEKKHSLIQIIVWMPKYRHKNTIFQKKGVSIGHSGTFNYLTKPQNEILENKIKSRGGWDFADTIAVPALVQTGVRVLIGGQPKAGSWFGRHLTLRHNGPLQICPLPYFFGCLIPWPMATSGLCGQQLCKWIL